ncbi:MAG: hypothetical protein HC921_15195 [Synechococcaceae cyanobacterium SM2_3_1]|nr:hypothetical protein [Synechococcaceae cyanobacterium SM2_3_1]
MRSTIYAYFGSSVSSQIEEVNLDIHFTHLIRSGSTAQGATEWIQGHAKSLKEEFLLIDFGHFSVV